MEDVRTYSPEEITATERERPAIEVDRETDRTRDEEMPFHIPRD